MHTIITVLRNENSQLKDENACLQVLCLLYGGVALICTGVTLYFTAF